MTEMYQGLSTYYDRIFSHINHRQWLTFVRRVWKKYKHTPSAVADFACGTGDFAALLAKQHYSVSAIDYSPDMLQQGKNKYSSYSITWQTGDMRTALLPAPVDTITCLHTSLNYMLNTEDLQKALDNFHRNLADGGICIFDMSSIANVLRFFDQQTFEYIYPEVSYKWINHYNSTDKSFLAAFIIQPRKNGKPYGKPFSEEHPHYIFSTDEIVSCIDENKWNILSLSKDFSFTPVTDKAKLIFFVLQRK